MAQRKGTTRGRRRQAAKAPVIDLEASEVAEETSSPAADQDETAPPADIDADAKAAASENEAEPDTKGEPEDKPEESAADTPAADEPSKGGRGKLIAAGVAGLLLAGAAGGAWLYRDVGANYFPSSASEKQASRIATLESKISNLEAANANGSAALTQLTSEIETLKTQLQASAAAIEAQGKTSDAATTKANEAFALAEQADKLAARITAATESNKAAADQAVGMAQVASKATQSATADLKAAQAGIDELKTAIAAAAASASSVTGDASETAKAAQAQISGLTLKLAELEGKIQTNSTAPQADPAMAQKIAELDTTVAALSKDLAEAREAQKNTSAAAAKSTEAQARRDQIVQALSELASNAKAGQPFASALSVLEPGLAAEPAFQAASAAAKTGVPDKVSILKDFSAVHSALMKPGSPPAEKPAEETQPQSSSLLSSLQNRLSSIIKIRPSGTKDWGKVADEMAAQAEKGQLDEMVQIAGNAAETPPAPLAAWLEKANARLALDRNITALSAKAMEQLATTSKTGG